MKAKNIYCLEYVKDTEKASHSPLYPWLEDLAMRYGLTSVHQHFDDIETLEEKLQILFYEDRHFQDYNLLYWVVQGQGDTLQIGNYYYRLEELAELLEGKLHNKILHFANTFTLDLDAEQIQYFLDLTRAKGLSGYSKRVPVLSTVLDAHYFSLVQDQEDVISLTEELYDKQPALASQLGFTMHYV